MKKTALLAPGPSLSRNAAQAARKWANDLIAVGDAWRLSEPDALYHADRRWWDYHWPIRGDFERFSVLPLSKKPAEQEKLKAWAKAKGITLLIGADECGVSMEPGVIHLGRTPEVYGGNSGFQALNLALLRGANEIRLYGYDMQKTDRSHFFGDHPREIHTDSPYAKFVKVYEHACKSIQAKVWNCTPGSALTCFEVCHDA